LHVASFQRFIRLVFSKHQRQPMVLIAATVGVSKRCQVDQPSKD
jgi:hypothetical protein